VRFVANSVGSQRGHILRHKAQANAREVDGNRMSRFRELVGLNAAACLVINSNRSSCATRVGGQDTSTMSVDPTARMENCN